MTKEQIVELACASEQRTRFKNTFIDVLHTYDAEAKDIEFPPIHLLYTTIRQRRYVRLYIIRSGWPAVQDILIPISDGAWHASRSSSLARMDFAQRPTNSYEYPAIRSCSQYGHLKFLHPNTPKPQLSNKVFPQVLLWRSRKRFFHTAFLRRP